MAKAQGKKKPATAARRATRKAASRVKSAARAVSKKAKAPAKPAKKIAKKVLAKAKAKVAKAKPAKTAKPPKTPKPAKPAKPVARPTAVPPPAPKAPVAPKVPAAPAPEAAKKTRTRRQRPRVHSNGTPVANWLPPGKEKPRPSSFIPAPPRAEAPSLIAAPPASSDRLIRPEDVTEFVTRTVPIRVDVEQGGGRFYVSVNPEEVTLRVGEGIEWDFRYVGGADVIADELIVEFEKPSPFTQGVFRSRKPGTARPHRQLSGAAQKAASGKRLQYTVRVMTPFKTELASAKLWLNVTG